MTLNSIYLRRARKLYVKEGTGSVSQELLATMLMNLEPLNQHLGFTFSQELIERVRTLTLERLESFYKQTVEDLKALTGGHRVFNPMYPNFPQQVVDASKAELYLRAMWHYFTNRLPTFVKEPRPELADKPEPKVIGLGSLEDFESMFTRMVRSSTSLSPQDKLDVAWFVAQYRDGIERLLPSEIPFKENLAFVGAHLMRETTIFDRCLAGKFKTATDVLRLAVALNDGDVSLAEATKFGKFPRRLRQQMLACLEATGGPLEDMLRWKERWKRLGERLHPGDYSEKFPKTYAAFSALRYDDKVVTFRGSLEAALEGRKLDDAMRLLEARPGDLARRLDHLLRIGDGETAPALSAGAFGWALNEKGDGMTAKVVSSFESGAAKVSTPVLLQVLTHFSNRSLSANRQSHRAFFPKGSVASVFAIPNRLPELPAGVAEQVAAICERTLIDRFAKLTALGKCYLDPALARYLVPISQRSAAKALRTIVRGSRMPLPDASTLRFFLWWKNGKSRTDIDLSAAFYDESLRYVDVVSYYNLKNFGGHHSGDIVDAPNGAAEFIDLDVAKAIERNVRYVVMSINSFTQQPYCDLPECFAGWMARSNPNSGEIFEPRTVQDRIDVASNTRVCLPLIADLVAREVIWADIALATYARWNNVHNNMTGVSLMLRALKDLRKTNLHTLFSLHIRARGTLVDNQASADTIFAPHTGITPFDIPRIASEFM